MSTFITSSSSNSSPPRAVLFLDVDGVLATKRCLTEDVHEEDSSLFFAHQLCPAVHGYFTPLEKSKIENLKTILDILPYVKIVISSTWRIDPNLMAFLLEALKAGGIDTKEVVLGGTPYSRRVGSCRGSEILEWLRINPEYNENFVIVDDEHQASFMSCRLADRVVKTEMHGDERNQGLSQEAVEKVLQLFFTPREHLDFAASSSVPVPPTPNAPPVEKVEGPKLVFLCGVPGIGKDSLCDYILEHFPVEFQLYKCYSQDQFAKQYGPQKGLACQQAVETALASGYSVILKRNNHMARDRKAYVDIAWHLGATTAAIVPKEFQSNKSIILLQIACRNAMNRTRPGGEGHETLSDGRIVPAVCSSFFKNFEPPTEDEVNFIHSIEYLTNIKQDEQWNVYPNGTPAKSLSADQMAEFERFVPHSTDPRTGAQTSLSFCQPANTMEYERHQRSKQSIAEDFVRIMTEIGFI